VIVPIISKTLIKKEDEKKRFEKYVRPDTQVDYVYIDYGPASIESKYDHDLAAPFVVGPRHPRRGAGRGRETDRAHTGEAGDEDLSSGSDSTRIGRGPGEDVQRSVKGC